MDTLELTTAQNPKHWIVRSPFPTTVRVSAGAEDEDEPEDAPEAHLNLLTSTSGPGDLERPGTYTLS